MIRVSVEYHKDGDSVVISWAPWWMPVWEFVTHRMQPCCGITGFLAQWDWWLGNWIYDASNAMSCYGDRFVRERFRIPIAAACVASEAIWPEDDFICFDDDCPYHQSGQGD